MESTSKINQFTLLREPLIKFVYQVFQQSKSFFSIAHSAIRDRLRNIFVPELNKITQPLSKQLLLEFAKRRKHLGEADWQDAQNGLYPVDILFDNPWQDFFRYYPEIWRDLPQIWSRWQRKEYQTFSPEIELQGYPPYYLQNFHYQTDGYLSDMSANLYDLQVEILFYGAADSMRRRILGPIKQGLTVFGSLPPDQINVLDVACGTGRTLKFLRATLPKASLFGVDLSPAYLRKAKKLFSKNPEELPQLVQANAENLPYPDNYFHGISSVFLFHELPPAARQRIIEECFRVTKPGGVFTICDSMQLLDSPEFEVSMENFMAMFHEPYYRNYITDNLVERLEKAGFKQVENKNYFASKYWIARKPEIISNY